MSDERSSSPVSRESLAEFLADREGLVGGARERFRRLLHDYGGFREASARSDLLRLPLALSLLVGAAGLLWDRPQGWTQFLVWIEYALLAAGGLWGLVRESIRSRHLDRETDWDAYRIFLRPVIMSDHPGLLDRNAVGAAMPSEPEAARSIPTNRKELYARGPDFWWMALLGLWIGITALVVVHGTVATTRWPWSLVFPAGGATLGLVAWLVWRRVAGLIMTSHEP